MCHIQKWIYVKHQWSYIEHQASACVGISGTLYTPLGSTVICLNMAPTLWCLVVSPNTASGKTSKSRAFHSMGLLELVSWYRQDMPPAHGTERFSKTGFPTNPQFSCDQTRVLRWRSPSTPVPQLLWGLSGLLMYSLETSSRYFICDWGTRISYFVYHLLKRWIVHILTLWLKE